MSRTLITVVLATLAASNLYLLQQWTPPSTLLTEEMIIAIVDVRQQENLLAQTRIHQKDRLTQLKSEFTLANVDAKTLIYGNVEAQVTLILFGDIECPFCRKMHKELKQIVDNSKGVINWQYKHFPLALHNPAAAAEAQAVECILEIHDNQSAWIALTTFIQTTQGNGRGIDNIVELARSFGLNGSLINFCLASNAHKDKINDDYAYARSLNITATPSIQIVDNQTNHSLLLKGYLPAEAVLQKIYKLTSPPPLDGAFR